MVHTFLLTLFFFFFLFSLLNVFGFFIYLTVSFSMCGFAGFFLCYGSFRYFTALVLLQFLQQRKVSSAKQHEYDWSTSSFILIFANIGFYFHCIHSPLLRVPALSPGLCLPFTSSTQFPIFMWSFTLLYHPTSCGCPMSRPSEPTLALFFSHHPCSPCGCFSLLSL